MKTFVTFGSDHTHVINGVRIDKDCVAVVDGDRDKVFELFGSDFSMEYPEQFWREEKLRYFPRGYVEVSA